MSSLFSMTTTAAGSEKSVYSCRAGSLKMNTALEYSTRVVQEGGRRCKKSTLNDLVHLTPLRIPSMNPPNVVLLYTIYNLAALAFVV